MPDMRLDDAVLDALRRLDTPSVCNALELLGEHHRTRGFTCEPLFCAFPELPPMVGFARTATIRTTEPSLPEAAARQERRLGYFAYVAEGAAPRIVVIEDRGGARAGFGAFWGEVNSALHAALGCLGVVTNGSVRDLHAIAPGFQLLAGRVAPSHGWADIVDWGGEVTVAGMTVRDGDLIHADRHGAVVVPQDKAADVPGAAARVARREAVLLAAARTRGLTVKSLRQAFAEANRTD